MVVDGLAALGFGLFSFLIFRLLMNQPRTESLHTFLPTECVLPSLCGVPVSTVMKLRNVRLIAEG